MFAALNYFQTTIEILVMFSRLTYKSTKLTLSQIMYLNNYQNNNILLKLLDLH